MSAKINNLNVSGTESFSDLEDRLERQVDNESVLAEIHVAIKELLSNSGTSEARIREILQKRYDSGDLRPESFELVQRMLDRIRSEDAADTNGGSSTLVLDGEASAQDDGAYARTLVLDSGVQADNLDDDEQFASTAVIGDDVAAEKSMDTQLQVGTILRDRFLLQQQVSGGHTGVVYKALDQRLAEAEDESNFVAIKVLPFEVSGNDKALRALQQEVAKGRCLNHPNIVRCIDLDREENLHFIVMEWLEGKSLATILEESGDRNIDFETTMDVVKQVSLALDYAHQRGVVHGDVNPGNIRITRDGEVKLFDFGIARVMQKEQDRQPDFDPRELGTKSPEYSSMQVLTGESPVPADDVFSLGCLMYRLIAGFRVFGPRSAAEAAAEGMEPQRPQGLTDKQWQALRKALAYSRVPRFSTPADFMAALDEAPPPASRGQAQRPASPRQAPPPLSATHSASQTRAPQTASQTHAPQATRPPQPAATTPPPTTRAPQTAGQTQAPQATRPPQPPTAPPPQAAPAPPARATPPLRVTPPPKLIVPDEPMVARNYDIGLPRSPWRLAVLGVILIGAAYGGIQLNLFERAEQLIPADLATAIDEVINGRPQEPVNEVLAETDTDAPVAGTVPEDAVAEPASGEETDAENIVEDGPVADAGDGEQPVTEETETESADADEPLGEATTAEALPAGAAADAATEPAVDETELLPPDLTVGLVASGQIVPEIDLTIREGAGSATIDLIRTHNLGEEYTVLLEEVGFSGNRSPWEEGQYVIANNGVATFEAGRNRVRTDISMPSDSIREADRQATIQIREIDNAESGLARIDLRLEDDDRRAYEATLPANTIAFSASEVFVSEADPAVRIDVVRFKPDSTAVEVAYVVRDVTTTSGEDYYPPGLPIVHFSPGQRSARILIPLVQDAEPEESEVFALEFENASSHIDPDIYQRIAVMIRDDD